MNRWQEVRKTVLFRDEGCCVRCGLEAADVHHRHPKGMGGTKDEKVAYGYANLISVCRRCHSWIHSHPVAAKDAGYIVPTGFAPETVFIVTKLGTLTLREDGTSHLQGLCDYF